MISENAGLDATEVIAQLKSAHAEGQSQAGLDIETGHPKDLSTVGIVDLFTAKATLLPSPSYPRKARKAFKWIEFTSKMLQHTRCPHVSLCGVSRCGMLFMPAVACLNITTIGAFSTWGLVFPVSHGLARGSLHPFPSGRGADGNHVWQWWALKLATEAVATVLRVDQIIMAKQAGGPKPRESQVDGDED